MNLRDIYYGYRPFSSEEEIIATVKTSKFFDENTEDIKKAKKIQLFETIKQRTFLVATSKRIYKIVDDRRFDKPKLSWSRKINLIFEAGKFKGSLIKRNANTSVLTIEAMPNKTNLVSTKLFANIDFNHAVENLSQGC